MTQSVLSLRTFRIMDDDGSKSLSYDEFKKGVRDYGVGLTESVRYTAQLNILLPPPLSLSRRQRNCFKGLTKIKMGPLILTSS